EPRFEHRFAGVVWRFHNEGNLAAFADDPDVYAPRYGGYDPVALARGVVLPGNPLFWIVSGERLYLFFDSAARDRFAADPKAAIDAAEEKWPELRDKLLP
ncbi:MAG TPA: YHS domain-containing (seleno)protein, partial [Xanthobacteraceae bacterium]|nr:YHS domain-containing (seleno)protein [Xanthobacteraceae bacterium]